MNHESRLIGWSSTDQRAAHYLAAARELIADSRQQAAGLLRRARKQRHKIFTAAAQTGQEIGVAELRTAVMEHLEKIAESLRSELRNSEDVLMHRMVKAVTETATPLLGRSHDVINDFAARCREAVPSGGALVETRINSESYEVEVDLPSGTLRFSLHDEFFAELRARIAL